MHDRRSELHRSGHLLHRHQEVAVAHQPDDLSARPGQLDPDSRRQSEPHRGETAGGYVSAGDVERELLQHLRLRVARRGDQVCVARHRRTQLAQELRDGRQLRLHRQELLDLARPLLLLAGEILAGMPAFLCLSSPRRPRARQPARRAPRRRLRRYLPPRVVLAYLVRVDVHVYQLCRRDARTPRRDGTSRRSRLRTCSRPPA